MQGRGWPSREGVEYEALGNATKLLAVDAGGQELGSSYYVDGQVATREQNKTLDSYVYDLAGRTMETTAEDTETNPDMFLETVNVEATLKCSESQVAIYIRVSLHYEHRGIVGEGDNEGYGKCTLSANASAKCQSGYYRGWAEFEAQGFESNAYYYAKWGKSRYVQC